MLSINCDEYFRAMVKIKKGDLLESVEITDAASEGMAIARHEGFVIFVEGGVPGDVADLYVYHNKKNYAEARIVKLLKSSEHRIHPVCEHFGICGGCKWQHMEYSQQLYYKQKQVTDVLKRVGKLELPEISPIIGSAKTECYRNRLDFTFANKRWLTKEEKSAAVPDEENIIGFHVPGRFDKVLDIKKCHLQDDFTNLIRNEIKRFANENNYSFNDVKEQQGLLRNLIIRSTSTGEWMVILVFRDDDKILREKLLSHVAKEFPQINSLLYIINPKRNDTVFDLDVHVYKGEDHITEVMEELKFKISAKSFYQTNSEQALQLYRVTRSFASLTGKELVYDLYTGTGTIASFVSKNAKHVIGIDYIEDAICDAKENAQNNNINNVSFFSGDIKDTLNDRFIQEHGKPDVIITDPPRSGMHEDVVKKILAIAPQRIVYVSCNPATQARDLNLLSESYKVIKLQPVDMFPHTSHVENVALLERIK
jgi:23S rRNA (uracil1939-C5)-methyltransferase